MPYTPQPNAILELGGLKATGVLTLEPGAGFHVQIKGGAVGSLWSDTRVTGALSSDYSQFRMTRAGVPKWRMGNNILGLGNDEFIIRRDAEGGLLDMDAMKITRSSGRVDFAGEVYSAGVLLGGGGGGGGTTNASALSSGTVPVLRLGSGGTRDSTTFLRGDNIWAVPPAGSGGGGGGGVSGSVFIPASDTAYGMKVRNAADTLDKFVAYGTGRLDQGDWSVAKPSGNSASAADMRAAYLAREAYGNPSTSTCIVSLVGAQLALVSNCGGVNTQWSGTQRYGEMGLSPDGGLRMSQNIDFSGGVRMENHRPSSRLGMESDGNYEYRYWQPVNMGAAPYGGSGKVLILSGPGRTSVAGEYTNTSSYMCLQGGRNIEFCTSQTNDAPLPVVLFQSTQRLGLFNRLFWVGTDGYAPMRLPSSSGIATGSGDVWFDGTNFKCNVGGVDKTFTIS